MNKDLSEILAVSARASDWEKRESNNSSLEALRREYDEMFTNRPKSPPPPQNLIVTAFWSDEDNEFVARSDGYPSLSGLAPTKKQALRELAVAIELSESIQEVKSPTGALAELRKQNIKEFEALDNLRKAILTGNVEEQFTFVPKLILKKLNFNRIDDRLVVHAINRNDGSLIDFANLSIGGCEAISRQAVLTAIELVAEEIIKSAQINKEIQ